MSNCTTPYTRFPFLCGNKKAKTVCLGLIVFLERVTGLQICCANLNPRNRRLLRRFPKNVPLARFLHGNPPHRFDSLYLVEIKKTKVGFPWLRDLLERVTGIEPALSAWKALAIPDRKLIQKYRLTSLHLANIVLTCCHFIKRTGRNTGKTRRFSNGLLMQESRL